MLETITGNGTRVGRTLRAHPVAIALIGAECGWLAISATGAGERLRQGASDAGTQARVWTGQLRDKFRGMAARSATEHGADVTEAGSRAYARVKSPRVAARARAALSEGAALKASAPEGQSVGHRTGEHVGINGRLADARERITEAVESHPLVTLAIAVLAGAVVGVALPTSKKTQESDGGIEGARPPE